jgi:hypothetical protein
MSPSWGSTPRQTDWPTVSRNVNLTLNRDQSVLSVAPTGAEASSHPTKDRRHFTEISGASDCNSEAVNDCTCECNRDFPINKFAESETRVNLLVVSHRQHATIYICVCVCVCVCVFQMRWMWFCMPRPHLLRTQIYYWDVNDSIVTNYFFL